MGTITPANGEYLALALVVTFGALLLFLGSMFARFRNAQRDIEMIDQMADES